jgi:hypothetical protein
MKTKRRKEEEEEEEEEGEEDPGDEPSVVREPDEDRA